MLGEGCFEFEHRISDAGWTLSLNNFSLVVVMVDLICNLQIETTDCYCKNQMQEHSSI